MAQFNAKFDHVDMIAHISLLRLIMNHDGDFELISNVLLHETCMMELRMFTQNIIYFSKIKLNPILIISNVVPSSTAYDLKTVYILSLK